MARPLTDRGKGHYWTVNESVDPRTGVHRVRKKKGKSRKTSEEIEGDYGEDDPAYEVPISHHYVQDLEQAGPSRQEPFAHAYLP